MSIIGRFLKPFRDNPEKPFYIDAINDNTYSRGEFHDLALKLAADLQRRFDLRAGDKLAVILPNSVEFALLYFACLYLRVTIVPLNPLLHSREVEYIIKSCRPSVMLFAPSTSDKINEQVTNELKIALACVVLRQETDLKSSYCGNLFNAMDSIVSAKPLEVDWDKFDDNFFYTLTYTSGTTQFPKGVMHRLREFVNNSAHYTEKVGVTEENRFYAVLSMAYMGGFYNMLLLPWIAGSTVAFSKTFEAVTAISFWKAPIQYHLNTLWLVPTMLAVLLKVDRDVKGQDYARSNIELILCGTAPLPIQLRLDFEKKYGSPVYENYGLSETLFVTTNTPKLPVRQGSVGTAIIDMTVSIHLGDGSLAESGQEGEIYVSSPDLMIGYYQSDDIQNAAIGKDGSFDTGDVGYFDDDGYLFITGRKKDLIIRGGINISPQAIENVLARHEGVIQAAVVGIPHPLYGEDIAAVVKLKLGFTLALVQPELESICLSELGSVRKPSQYLEIDDFPATPTGKIQKNKLREIVKVRLGM